MKRDKEECCKIIQVVSGSYDLTSIYQANTLGLYIFDNIDKDDIITYKKVESDGNGNIYYLRGNNKHGWKVIAFPKKIQKN